VPEEAFTRQKAPFSYSMEMKHRIKTRIFPGNFPKGSKMNRIHRITTALMLCGAAAVMGQNLLTNPGFESGGSGWTLFTQAGSPAVAAVTYPTTGARTGTRFGRVEVTQPAASAAENWHVQLQPPTGWSAGIGATYEFKFWAKADSGRNIHVSVQNGGYTYLTGVSFGLTTEWTEYSMTHEATEEGTSAVRFHVYVAESKGVYDFDDFSVTALTAGVRGGSSQGQALRVRQEPGSLVLSLGSVSGAWKADLLDLRGTSVATAAGKADGSARLALPKKGGAYFVRASTPTRSWVRKVLVP
jgi:hypothetical protein